MSKSEQNLINLILVFSLAVLAACGNPEAALKPIHDPDSLQASKVNGVYIVSNYCSPTAWFCMSVRHYEVCNHAYEIVLGGDRALLVDSGTSLPNGINHLDSNCTVNVTNIPKELQ